METLVRFRSAAMRSMLSARGPLILLRAHKSKHAIRKMPTDMALEHFDSFYPKVFGKVEWRSIRLGLLSQKKYCAVVNPFAETEELHALMNHVGAERMVIAPPEVKSYSDPVVNRSEFPEHIPMIDEEVPQEFLDSSRVIKKGHSEPLLSFVPATEMVYQEEMLHDEEYFNFLKPEKEVLMKTSKPLPFLPLTIYTYPAGSVKDFPKPHRNNEGLLNYYLMDAASLLPVMALGITEGDSFADFCAAPGGKTLAVAFMDKTDSHYCIDESPNRVRRLRQSLESYLPEEQRSKVEVKQIEVKKVPEVVAFNKILVDVPCTNDRHSLADDENNIFQGVRTHERLHIPQEQADILKLALKRLKIGGVVVYSTCTLSPIQNDSVVHMSLQSFSKMKFVVTNLEKSFEPLAAYFQIHKCRYGQLVLPYLPNNFGPMYICRIERVQ